MHIKVVYFGSVHSQAERSACTATGTTDRKQSAATEKTAASRQTRAARRDLVMAERRCVVHGEKTRGGAQHGANVALRKALWRAQRGVARSHRSRSTASNEHWVCGGERIRADTCVSARSSEARAVACSSSQCMALPPPLLRSSHCRVSAHYSRRVRLA